MDGYLQSLSNDNNRSIPQSSVKFPPPPCPPPDKENDDCRQFRTPEGVYDMTLEMFFESIQPCFSIGTQVTMANVHHAQSNAAFTKTSSSESSSAEIGIVASSANSQAELAEEESHGRNDDNDGIMFLGSHSDRSSRHAPSILIETLEPQPLPIPKAPGLVLHDSFPSLASSAEPLSKRHSIKKLASSFQPSSTLDTPGHLTPSLSLESHDDLSASYGGGGSTNSLSSLFSGRNRRQSVRRPKNSLSKIRSSFVDQVILYDQLSKWMGSRPADSTFIFFNVGTNFLWMDACGKLKEPLARIVFNKVYPTCHAVNTATLGNERVDTIIGFSSGDCLWYDPVGHRYTRVNKNGIMNPYGVTSVQWVPGSEELFLAAFADGSILLLDKDREDQPFTSPPPETWTDEQFFAFKPCRQKYNPLSSWHVGTKGITALSFSPDGHHVAVVGADGLLRIIDYTNESLCDIFAGYYGKLGCVAWSPDGHYILTGGQDDLVTIWSFREQHIIARCQGHKSWVTGVAFDPLRCDGELYRFASVGEDCKLILWDFSVNALHRPKHKIKRQSTSTTFGTYTIPTNLARNHEKDETSATDLDDTQPNSSETSFNEKKLLVGRPPPGRRVRKRSILKNAVFGMSAGSDSSNTGYTKHMRLPIIQLAPGKTDVPFLQPTVIRAVHADPCVSVVFSGDSIFTTDRRGRVRKWQRCQTS